MNIKSRILKQALVGSALLAMSQVATALDVEIGDQRVAASTGAGEACVDLTGVYGSIRVEPTEPFKKKARVCGSARRKNALKLFNVSVVAVDGSPQAHSIVIKNRFATGPNGVLYARMGVKGFFAKATGASVPTGNKVGAKGFFIQAENADEVGDSLEHVVEGDIESGLVKMIARDEYLASGEREVRLELSLTLRGNGDKFIFDNGTVLVLDGAQNFKERLEGWSP
ncbi:MAG: hypothetical protein AAF493_05495 [Pseudomonadota bacterium]